MTSSASRSKKWEPSARPSRPFSMMRKNGSSALKSSRSVITSGMRRGRRRRAVGAERRGGGGAGADRAGHRGALGHAGEPVPLIGWQFGGDGDGPGDRRLAVVGDVVAHVDLDGGESPAFALRVHAQRDGGAGGEPAEEEAEWCGA